MDETCLQNVEQKKAKYKKDKWYSSFYIKLKKYPKVWESIN